MEDNKQLEKFIQEQTFSDPIFAGITKFIIDKYPEESERRRIIRIMVEIWQQKYGSEMDKFQNNLKRRRELSKNEFSADDASDIRVLFSIPSSLHTRINMVIKDPPFLSEEANKKLNEAEWFYNEFPQFRVSSKY